MGPLYIPFIWVTYILHVSIQIFIIDHDIYPFVDIPNRLEQFLINNPEYLEV